MGFNNLANFNRRFLEIKGLTPTEFRLLAVLMENPGYAFTRSQLTQEDLAYLAALKFVRNVRDFTIVHATPLPEMLLT